VCRAGLSFGWARRAAEEEERSRGEERRGEERRGQDKRPIDQLAATISIQ